MTVRCRSRGERDVTAKALSPGVVRELHRERLERSMGRYQWPRLDRGLLRGHGTRPRTRLLRLYDPRGHLYGVGCLWRLVRDLAQARRVRPKARPDAAGPAPRPG